MHALGLEFGSAAQLSKRPGSVWNCLWGNALKRSPGIIRKSRVSYPVPGFLSSATWPSLPKKHYNGLNQTNQIWKNKDIHIMLMHDCPLLCYYEKLWPPLDVDTKRRRRMQKGLLLNVKYNKLSSYSVFHNVLKKL